MTWTPHHMQDNQEKQTPKPSVNPFKWVLLGVGGIVASCTYWYTWTYDEDHRKVC